MVIKDEVFELINVLVALVMIPETTRFVTAVVIPPTSAALTIPYPTK